MPPPRVHRSWVIAYFASWMLAACGASGLVAMVAWSAYGSRLIDEDAALLGIPVGVGLGFFAARATLRRPGVHRLLVVVGLVGAVVATAGAVSMFAAARASRGDGPFVGLGEAIVGLVSAAVAAICVACLAAGAFGRLASRTQPEQTAR